MPYTETKSALAADGRLQPGETPYNIKGYKERKFVAVAQGMDLGSVGAEFTQEVMTG
jgi:hypothetical protein